MAVPTETARLRGLRVLIVEDEMLLALDYQATLESEGCAVIGPVPSAADAQALLEAERPDAVILDLNLAGERPTAFAEALTESGVPFVIVTGYYERHLAEPVFRDAPRLDKPASPEALVRAVAKAAREAGRKAGDRQPGPAARDHGHGAPRPR